MRILRRGPHILLLNILVQNAEPEHDLCKDARRILPTDAEGPQVPLSSPESPAPIAPSELHRQHQDNRRKVKLQGDPITIALKTVKLEDPKPPTKPISICLVGAASFAALSKDPRVELFAATMLDVEKALQAKTKPARASQRHRLKWRERVPNQQTHSQARNEIATRSEVRYDGTDIFRQSTANDFVRRALASSEEDELERPQIHQYVIIHTDAAK